MMVATLPRADPAGERRKANRDDITKDLLDIARRYREAAGGREDGGALQDTLHDEEGIPR